MLDGEIAQREGAAAANIEDLMSAGSVNDNRPSAVAAIDGERAASIQKGQGGTQRNRGAAGNGKLNVVIPVAGAGGIDTPVIICVIERRGDRFTQRANPIVYIDIQVRVDRERGASCCVCH